MRDEQRIDTTLALLRQAWKKVPDWRLGQLLMNLHGMGEGTASRRDLFYQEDYQWERALKAFVEEGK